MNTQGAAEAGGVAAVESSNQSCRPCSKSRSRSRSTSTPSFSLSKPSWLRSTIADLDDKMKALALNNNVNNNTTSKEEYDKTSGDSFAERAEAYYQTRPQLLALLQDLYNGYLSLADRYSQTLAKHHRRQHSSPITPVRFADFSDQEEDNNGQLVDSDAESSLSYQQPPMLQNPTTLDADALVAELVIKMVDYDILTDELGVSERHGAESSKKIELQKSLLEVLESERVILLNENARLGYRVVALAEENKGLVGEALFMKRKAGELARCVLKMREDHRVGMLSRKIEDLQGQIYSLERRNKEYHQQLREQETTASGKSKSSRKKISSTSKGGGEEVTLEDCFQVVDEEETSSSSSSSSGAAAAARTSRSKRGYNNHGYGGGGSRKGGVSKWWSRVKNFDMFLCGPHPNFSFC